MSTKFYLDNAILINMLKEAFVSGYESPMELMDSEITTIIKKHTPDPEEPTTKANEFYYKEIIDQSSKKNDNERLYIKSFEDYGIDIAKDATEISEIINSKKTAAKKMKENKKSSRDKFKKSYELIKASDLLDEEEEKPVSQHEIIEAKKMLNEIEAKKMLMIARRKGMSSLDDITKLLDAIGSEADIEKEE